MPNPARCNPRRSLIPFLGAAVLSLGAAGCNIVGPAAYFIMGPEKIEARYTIPDGTSAVIFIDDRRSALPDRSLRKRIAAEAEKIILKEYGEIDLIASQAILELATRDRFTRPQGIVEMGEAVGAKMVIYATVDGFTLSADGSTYAPAASVRLKVIDVAEKKRAWPADPEEWETVTVGDKPKAGELPRSSAEQLKAQQVLAERLGREIGRVFVKHEPESDSRIGGDGP